ncbi:uncharacterized protein KY384_001208 [Bacidia gigantensis]|uniref:uncharacterized protein n=1 Tax=Bacidia gigantensis TaxID=2732470 RepID=UPI001D0372E5|nr:uncharacterized protein KY384_001208 [Bacidia gigantensis]KAG8534363.1 hypothetical protein KY384_001208 [Bacidia gigantensis]
MPSTASNSNDIITTDRLLLRAARQSDLDDFHAIFSNDDVMRYWSNPPHTELSQTKEYLMIMINSPNNGIIDFVIVLRPTTPYSGQLENEGPVIGKAGVWSPASHPKPELGFMINRDYWGKGYMKEALGALIPLVWEQGITMMQVDVDPRNDASIATCKKFGFVEVGTEENTVKTHLGWCDSVFLQLERPEEGVEGGNGRGE